MITVYTKPNCPHCVEAKHYLYESGIAFSEIDVTQDVNAISFLRAQGHRTVPQFYAGSKLLFEGGNQSLQRLTPQQIRMLTSATK